MTDDAASVSEAYANARRDKDFVALRSILADDVQFSGPLAELNNAEDCVAGLRRMSEIVTGLDIKKRFVDGPDVLTSFELQTRVADPVPTANWTHVEAGKVTAIRVAFDARPFSPPHS